MDYGLIGHPLGHSFSKEIHESLADYTYELCDVAPEKLDAFMREKRFKAFNVTIPHKQSVIPYLDAIDGKAKTIGAVNTIVNNNGVLYGYNTDLYGLTDLILRNTDTLSGKTVLILGSGGTSKTAHFVCRNLGASTIYKATRNAVLADGSDLFITYDRLSEIADTVDVIINCTPVGMYPNIDASAVNAADFPHLSCVIDAVYNPLRTKLVSDARERGIRAEGGLYMLVSQAVYAIEYFLDTKIDKSVTDRIYRKVLSDRENIVLIGMPGSGKTTIGKYLSEKTGKRILDTDELITKKYGHPSDIIKTRGENAFRELESEIIREVSEESGIILATGGGAVLRRENVTELRKNGRLFFLDRPIENIVPTGDRPLSATREELNKRYNERYGIYTSVSDEHIVNDGSIASAVERILQSR